MAWNNPLTWVAGAVVTAAQMNTYIKDNLAFLRNGVVNLTSITTNSAATVGTNELTLATSGSVTFDGSTITEVSFNWYSFTLSVATDAFVVRVYDGATMIGQCRVGAASASPGSVVRSTLTPTAGAHTFTARVVRATGTGTATLIAQADAPAQLLVRQCT